MRNFTLLINGEHLPGDTTMPVYNPATGAIVTQAPRASRTQLDLAVAAASAAFPDWAATGIEARKRALQSIADTVAENAQELASVLTTEHGKPLTDSNREIAATAAFFRFVSAMDLPTRVATASDGCSIHIERVPLGPVAAIVPWNFPLLTVAFKVPFALLAGNTVVVKTAPTTPLTTLRFAELVAPLLPPGVLNVITDDDDLGDALTSHPDIRKVTFTGSTSTGQKVMANAVASLKRLTLELGGNDCAIVLPDANPVEIAPSLFQAAFYNNGQVCLAVKRLYVHDDIYDDLCNELAKLADATVVGDGTEDGVELGPIQNARQFAHLKNLLDLAREDGKVIAGGEVLDRPGYFIRPTIVRDITDGSAVVDREQFGPILPVIAYSDLDEVISRANGTDFGLGASVWSADETRALDVARRIDAGTVWVNKHAELAPNIPFGGAKMSGLGTEFAQEGLIEFTQLKVISGTRA